MRDALAIHERLLALHGGAEGFGIQGLLESALARPAPASTPMQSSPGVIELAALYTAAIVRNHPFVDGNKRTGLRDRHSISGTERFDFKASEEDATQAILGLRGGHAG